MKLKKKKKNAKDGKVDNAAEIILQMKKDFITSSMRITTLQTCRRKWNEKEKKKKEKRTMCLIKWNNVDTETKKSKESRGKWIR